MYHYCNCVNEFDILEVGPIYNPFKITLLFTHQLKNSSMKIIHIFWLFITENIKIVSQYYLILCRLTSSILGGEK